MMVFDSRFEKKRYLMGLDASVRCRCWEEGKCTPPPYSDFVHLDNEGYVNLDLPWQSHRDEHRIFYRWQESCCPHKGMNYAIQRISNWTGYRLFQQKLEEIGWGKFPSLQETLPSANGGRTYPELAARALIELDLFAEQDFGHMTALIDQDTGRVLHHYVEAYEGLFYMGPGWSAGVAPEGFFIRRESLRFLRKFGMRTQVRVVFRSNRFTQEIIRRRRFRLRDVETGLTITTPIGIATEIISSDSISSDGNKDCRSIHAKNLAVEQRRADASKFAYILKPLKIVFRAAIETGNPVRWF